MRCFSEALRYFGPYRQEALDHGLIREKIVFREVSGIVKIVSAGLVQVEDNVHVILFRHLHELGQTRIAGFDGGAVFVLNDVVIKGQTHMVESPLTDLFHIRRIEKCIVM